MAEVLSQSQIDALLNSMAVGNMPDKPVEETKDKKYKKYDFYSPKKFTKDRLKMLNGVYESYARVVSSCLNSLLRVTSEVEVVTVEEQRYYEFSNALTENDALTIVNVGLPDGSEQDPIIIHTSAPLMLNMVDRMLGGTGEDTEDESSRAFTEIELALYESIIKYLIPLMKDGWSNYLDLTFNFTRLETNPSLMQVIGMDEIIVIVVLDVNLQNIAGKINICLPANLLTRIFTIFERTSFVNRTKDAKKEKATDEIMASIKNSTLEVKAKLGDTQLLLSDIFSLQVGDVINLNAPKDSEIYLYIGDTPWFKGKLGVQNKNLAVKISEVCDDL